MPEKFDLPVFSEKYNIFENYIEKKTHVPYFQKYGLALNTISGHIDNHSVCFTSLTRLLHCFALLDSMLGTSGYSAQVIQASMHPSKGFFTPDKAAEVLDNAGFFTEPVTDRYNEVLSRISQAAVKAAKGERKKINPIKSDFIRLIGGNNNALLFNPSDEKKRSLPRKFELFRDVLDLFTTSPKIQGSDYQKLMSVFLMVLPSAPLFKANSVNLIVQGLSPANARNEYTLVYSPTMREHYIQMDAYRLMAVLTSVVPVAMNEECLATSRLRNSLSSVMNTMLYTMSLDNKTAYTKLSEIFITYRLD